LQIRDAVRQSVRMRRIPGRPESFLFRRQAVHGLFLVALPPVAWALAAPSLGDGAWQGVPETTWFALCLAIPVAHQVYIWLAWRGQLGWGIFTRLFGRADFGVHLAIFFLFLGARPLVVLAASLADVGSLRLPAWLAFALAGLLAVPASYTVWSVVRYFGLARAAGGDHFRRRYCEMPLVTQGVFAWTPNAMYTFAFLLFWIIPLLARSQAGLVAALFQHAYIWVHYGCTEVPDMEVLYGSERPGGAPSQ
jgi:hypothetical protein